MKKIIECTCGNCKFELLDSDRGVCVECNGENFKPKEKKDLTDNVNHPKHYTQGKFECIDAIEEITKPLDKFEAYLVGTILKYLWRFKFKNGLEDLKKARWYLDKLINKMEVEE